MSVDTLERLKSMLKNLQTDYESAKHERLVEEKEFEKLQLQIKEMDDKLNDFCTDIKTYRNTYQVRNNLASFIVRCCQYTERLKEALKQLEDMKTNQTKADVADGNLETANELRQNEITAQEVTLTQLINGSGLTAENIRHEADYVSLIDSIQMKNIKKEKDIQDMRKHLTVLEKKISTLTKSGTTIRN